MNNRDAAERGLDAALPFTAPTARFADNRRAYIDQVLEAARDTSTDWAAGEAPRQPSSVSSEPAIKGGRR